MFLHDYHLASEMSTVRTLAIKGNRNGSNVAKLI